MDTRSKAGSDGAARQTGYMRAYRARKRAAGLCTHGGCYEPLAMRSISSCVAHLTRNLVWQRQRRATLGKRPTLGSVRYCAQAGCPVFVQGRDRYCDTCRERRYRELVRRQNQRMREWRRNYYEQRREEARALGVCKSSLACGLPIYRNAQCEQHYRRALEASHRWYKRKAAAARPSG